MAVRPEDAEILLEGEAILYYTILFRVDMLLHIYLTI
jgi:hypothetical protein